MTDFEHMKRVRLPNWARWGRQDDCRPDNLRLSSALCGKTVREDDEAPLEAMRVPLDERDAEEIDFMLRQIAQQPRAIIRSAYYLRNDVRADDLNAAIRSLLDAFELNRFVRRKVDGLRG